jgi:hypothetical protein
MDLIDEVPSYETIGRSPTSMVAPHIAGHSFTFVARPPEMRRGKIGGAVESLPMSNPEYSGFR